jgi:hypothetical protein
MLLAGCTTMSFTPVVSTIPFVASDVAKSKLIAENCGSVSSFHAEGDFTLADLLKNKKITKVTFVDYQASIGIIGGKVCMKVYGY